MLKLFLLQLGEPDAAGWLDIPNLDISNDSAAIAISQL